MLPVIVMGNVLARNSGLEMSVELVSILNLVVTSNLPNIKVTRHSVLAPAAPNLIARPTGGLRVSPAMARFARC